MCKCDTVGFAGDITDCCKLQCGGIGEEVGQRNFIAGFTYLLKYEESVGREQTQREGGNRRDWIEDKT
jgi:hypothetical protein